MSEHLITQLRQKGVRIRLDGDRVHCDAPPNVMTPNLMEQLRAHKELIVEILKKEATAPEHESVIPVISRQMEIPLSFAQESLWFLDQLKPEAAIYNIPLKLHILGEIDEDALRRSLNEIVRRHEILRTRLRTSAGKPIQVIETALTLSVPIVDLTDVPEEIRQEQADRLCREQAERPFALDRDSMLRATIFRLESEKHILFLNMHHIASDAWSVGILLRELSILYEAFSKGHPSSLQELPIQYADFAVWQRGHLTEAVLTRQLNYWKGQLDGAPAALDLPTEWPRPAVQSFRGATESAEIPGSMVTALKTLSRREGASLFMTLLAAFQILLYRYSGETDISVGSPVANRSRVELESLIGLFVNALPLRVNLSGNPTFRELLSRTKQIVLEAYENQDVPFEVLVKELQPERNLGYSPLFQVFFALQNTSPELAKLKVQADILSSATAKFDLSLNMSEFPDGMRADIEYCTDLFGREMIRRMLDHFTVLLNSIVENPDEPINILPLLTVTERQHLLVECNQTTVKHSHEKYLDELFEEQAKATPDRAAVRFGDDLLTYRQLNERADEVANHLRLLGIGSNDLVGLYVERSSDIAVGLLGILKAGAAYLPLDPLYPPDRLAFMLEDARPKVVLTQKRLEGELSYVKTKLVFLDDLSQLSLEPAFAAKSAHDRAPNDLAYVIYTSGSTGTPKGVQIEHRSIVNFLHSMQKNPGLTAKDALLAVTTLSFDIAALEFFLPLTVGAQVVVASLEAVADATQLVALLERHRITVMQATPATWRLLLESNWAGTSNLKILCGGEAWPSELADQLLVRCGSLWNMYGPTETTVWSSAYKIERGERVLIGPPIANTNFYVLDEEFQLVPLMVPGELYIGGDGVARGYLSRPELTQEKFIRNPFSHDGQDRLYRTGDLVRRLPNGAIEFLGRIDNQVKIRGFRIELDEIASVLRQHNTVKDAVVVVQEDGALNKRLVAYVVALEGQRPDDGDLRAFLKRQLPTYMVPSAFEIIERFPMTPSGKIDRKALQKASARRAERKGAHVPPRTTTEQIVAQVWSDILGVENVGVSDDFFDLGGHSLMIVQMLYQVNTIRNIHLGVPELFQNPTVEQLAKIIDDQHPEGRRQPVVVQLKDGGSETPLYFIYAGPDEFHLAQFMGPNHKVFGVEVPWPLEWRRAVEGNRLSSFPNLEQFVAPFVNVLSAHLGSGSCVVAGHCFAGIIAFEVAHQLQLQGGKVETVIIVDGWAKHPDTIQIAWENLKRCWMETPGDPQQGFGRSLMSRSRRTFLIVWWLLNLNAGRLRKALIPSKGQLTTTFDEAGVPLHWGLLERLYQRLAKNYRPQALDCGGIIIRTEFMDIKKAVHVLDEHLGWERLFTGGSVAFAAAGDHLSMIREHNQSLALMIDKALHQPGKF